MTRSIAILSLALIATVGADEVFAQANPQTALRSLHIDSSHTELLRVDILLSEALHGSVASCTQCHLDSSEHSNHEYAAEGLYLAGELDGLIAIIAFEYGPEAAYVTLRDMGFSQDEADALFFDAINLRFALRDPTYLRATYSSPDDPIFYVNHR